MKKRKMLVTCAFPYANGSIHLGHMLEHIQADIWVRYHRMKDREVHFICADDAHGTPIMLKAKKLGILPEEMIRKIYIEHKQDLSKFNISYDNYYSTHSHENYALSISIYKRLKKKGFIISKEICQLFDEKKSMFLSDRLIKGSCPKCSSENQYGDTCEVCGAIYSSKDLINPKSILSKTSPIIQRSKHLFFNLPLFEKELQNWIYSIQLQEQVLNKLKEWFKIGLKPWDISRDAPYFGFKFPDEKNKYFYVWLDATIGYIGTFKNLCLKNKNIYFDEFWKFNSNADLFHFIGKDIIHFHCLFWPAILESIKLRKPTNIFVHGYVLLNGKKMSKSNGTLIKASTYLKYLDSDCLRYYYASKLSLQITDIDLNLEDFLQKVNTDIVNKLVNLAARNASILNFRYKSRLSYNLENPNLFSLFIKSCSLIEEWYEKLEIGCIIREVMKLTDIANRYIDEKSPWILAKKYGYNKNVQSICSMGIELFKILMTYLKPVLPSLAKKSEKFLNIHLKWEKISFPLRNHCINTFNKLFARIEKKSIKNLINHKR